VNVCEGGEYRPEESMDCIPKSSPHQTDIIKNLSEMYMYEFLVQKLVLSINLPKQYTNLSIW
jgi:hypothetical protein